MARSAAPLKELRDSLFDCKRHQFLAVDLTDVRRLRKGINRAIEFLDGVDVVLHAAGGGLGLRDPLLPYEDMLKLLQLNILVAAEINRLVIPHMRKNQSGNLVHIGSIASSEATASVGYNTAKAALAAYVRSLGRETAGSGIIATGILPGGFYAPGNSWERLKSKNPGAVRRFVAERLPRKFLGRSEELIPMLLLLCSDSASMMSGCMVPMDAGEGQAYLAA